MRLVLFLGGLVVVLGVVVLGGGLWWRWVSGPAVPGSSQVVWFVVPRGQAAEEVGRRLVEVGVIRSGLAFKLWLSFLGRAGEVQAGEYRMCPGKSLYEVVGQLLAGPEDVWVTILEGWRKEQVAVRLVASLELKGEERERFLAEFVVGAREGYLFPDTYLVPKEAGATRVLEMFRQNFDRRVGEMVKGGGEGGERDGGEVLIMASLVEREARNDVERPIIAGILWKRLKAGWPLQVDAGLQYAKATQVCGWQRWSECTDWWPEVGLEDKKMVSVYNTYLNRGLPPGPIGNPGLASIEAAASPKESEYWFYLHDAGGGGHFAKTLEEHAVNITRYLR